MVDFRPHTLRYSITTDGYEDPVNGDWIPGVTKWSEPAECRYEPNGKANTIALPDGKFYTYSYTVYLDIAPKIYQFGEQVQLFDQTGAMIAQKQVQGFHQGQLNMRIWV